MQLLCSLYKAGLVSLFQHLLSVAHQTTVLQHALVLVHLGKYVVEVIALLACLSDLISITIF